MSKNLLSHCASFRIVNYVLINKHLVSVLNVQNQQLPGQLFLIFLPFKTYHLNKWNDKYVIYRITLFNISSINRQKELMLIKTHQVKSKLTHFKAICLAPSNIGISMENNSYPLSKPFL